MKVWSHNRTKSCGRLSSFMACLMIILLYHNLSHASFFVTAKTLHPMYAGKSDCLTSKWESQVIFILKITGFQTEETPLRYSRLQYLKYKWTMKEMSRQDDCVSTQCLYMEWSAPDITKLTSKAHRCYIVL